MKVAVGPPMCAEKRECKCERERVSERVYGCMSLSPMNDSCCLAHSCLGASGSGRCGAGQMEGPHGSSRCSAFVYAQLIKNNKPCHPEPQPSGAEPACSFLPASQFIVGGWLRPQLCLVASDSSVNQISNSALILLEISGSRLIGIHRYAYPCTIPVHSGRIFHGLPLLSSLWYIFYPSRLKIQLFHFLWYVAWLSLTQYWGADKAPYNQFKTIALSGCPYSYLNPD